MKLPAVRTREKKSGKGALARTMERVRSKIKGIEPPKPAAAPAAAPAAVGSFYLAQVCAVTGKAYGVVYEKAQGGFTAVRAFDLEGAAGLSERPPQIPATMDSASVHGSLPCFHCGASKGGYAHIRCGSCRRLVCTGRCYDDDSGEFVFVCATGCGGSGKLESAIKSYEIIDAAPESKKPGGKERPKAVGVKKRGLLGR